MELGEALTLEAARRKIGQREAAKQLGVSQQTFGRWCMGITRPAPEHAAKVARWLKISQADYAEMYVRSDTGRGSKGNQLQARLKVLETRVERLEAQLETAIRLIGGDSPRPRPRRV